MMKKAIQLDTSSFFFPPSIQKRQRSRVKLHFDRLCAKRDVLSRYESSLRMIQTASNCGVNISYPASERNENEKERKKNEDKVGEGTFCARSSFTCIIMDEHILSKKSHFLNNDDTRYSKACLKRAHTNAKNEIDVLNIAKQQLNEENGKETTKRPWIHLVLYSLFAVAINI